MKIYSRLASYAFKYRLIFSVCLFFVLIYVASQIFAVMRFSDFFFNAFIGSHFEKVNIFVIAALLGIGLLYALSHYFIYLTSNYLAISVMHDIRRDIFRKLVDTPLFYFKKNKTGEIMSRVLNDIGIIENFFMNIAMDLFLQPLTLIAIIVFMFMINAKISLYMFSIGPILALALGSIGAIVQRLSLGVQKNISDITSGIQEAIYGMEIIKGYGVEESFNNKFKESNDIHLKAVRHEMRIRFLGTPVSEFLGVTAILIILALGAMSIAKGIATTQEILNFFFAAFILAQPLSRSSDIFMILKKLQPAGARVFEIIDSEEKEETGLPDIGIIHGNIEFRKLFFKYEEDRTALKSINLDIRHGETVAIVGQSGAGKSTLISLIPVFYKSDRGNLYIDGKNVKEFNPLSIRRQISIVTQESILFSGSVMDNIRLSSPDASRREAEEAAGIANAHSFISQLPQGYETVLGERGIRLSGGEKQRIALARAILRRPKILILDEATSSLDTESEELIQKAMKKILGRQTTLVVSHKLSTIINADRIVVMDKGRIIETGTHKELIDQGGIYKRLFKIQVDL